MISRFSVQDPFGQRHSITFSVWKTVKDLKDHLQEVVGIPSLHQRLFMASVELRNTRTLLDSGVREGSSLILTKKFDPRASPLNQSLVVYGGFSCPQELQERITEARQGIARGLVPRLSMDGTGGTYFLKNVQKDVVAVFKPGDEEPFAPNNPRGHVGPLGSAGLRAGVHSGEGYLREVAAYLLDHDHVFDVPQTTLAELHSSKVNRNRFNFGESQPSGVKVGSLQEFVTFDDLAGDLACNKFPAFEVHKIGILDVLIMNIDRNDANILVQRPHGSGSHVKLIPIDHAYSLPDTLEIAWTDWAWMQWPQAKQPFEEFWKNYVATIDIDREVHMLRETLNLRAPCLRIFRIAATLLQKSVAAGLTLFDIASIITRDDMDQPSELENCCAQATIAAKTAVENVRLRPSILYNGGRIGVGAAAKRIPEETTLSDSGGENSSVSSPVHSGGSAKECTSPPASAAALHAMASPPHTPVMIAPSSTPELNEPPSPPTWQETLGDLALQTDTTAPVLLHANAPRTPVRSHVVPPTPPAIAAAAAAAVIGGIKLTRFSSPETPSLSDSPASPENANSAANTPPDNVKANVDPFALPKPNVNQLRSAPVSPMDDDFIMSPVLPLQRTLSSHNMDSSPPPTADHPRPGWMYTPQNNPGAGRFATPQAQRRFQFLASAGADDSAAEAMGGLGMSGMKRGVSALDFTMTPGPTSRHLSDVPPSETVFFAYLDKLLDQAIERRVAIARSRAAAAAASASTATTATASKGTSLSNSRQTSGNSVDSINATPSPIFSAASPTMTPFVFGPRDTASPMHGLSGLNLPPPSLGGVDNQPSSAKDSDGSDTLLSHRSASSDNSTGSRTGFVFSAPTPHRPKLAAALLSRGPDLQIKDTVRDVETTAAPTPSSRSLRDYTNANAGTNTNAGAASGSGEAGVSARPLPVRSMLLELAGPGPLSPERGRVVLSPAARTPVATASAPAPLNTGSGSTSAIPTAVLPQSSPTAPGPPRRRFSGVLAGLLAKNIDDSSDAAVKARLERVAHQNPQNAANFGAQPTSQNADRNEEPLSPPVRPRSFSESAATPPLAGAASKIIVDPAPLTVDGDSVGKLRQFSATPAISTSEGGNSSSAADLATPSPRRSPVSSTAAARPRTAAHRIDDNDDDFRL